MSSESQLFRVVGHGLAGCVMAMTLYRRNLPFTIMGIGKTGEASLASSGLIAPVTGRRYVKAWRIDEFIPKAHEFYRWTEDLLGQIYFYPIDIVRFLSNPEALTAWEKRSQDPEYRNYISNVQDASLQTFQRPYGILKGGYRLDTPGWVNAVRTFLQQGGFFEGNLFADGDSHDTSRTIIFATGAMDEHFAHGIIPNKGESLVVRMPQWTIRQVIKDEVFIVPLQESGNFWIGSYYGPGDADPYPTMAGRERLLKVIKNLHSGPVEVLEHHAGIRPTVDDRRPVIGSRPGYPHQYLFNGMGTKGTSLAPYWADQLVSHLTENLPLPEQVSPARYP